MKDSRAFAVLATDIAVLTVDGSTLKILLTLAKSESFRGEPALPGGLVGPFERTADAAERILKGSLQRTDFYTEQLYTFDDPHRDPKGRVVSVGYLVLIPWNIAIKILKEGSSWQAVKTLPMLAYDHNEIVKKAVKRLKSKLTYTNVVYTLVPSEFRMSDLQKIYETVLETPIDKRNFVKKIKNLKLLSKTGQKMEGEAHRPAALYRFADRKLNVVEVF